MCLSLPVAMAEGLQTDPYASSLPDLGESINLAQADSDAPVDEAVRTEQCLAFARDIDADLGEVLRAGCEPTLEQMSALMDNPLGNVAMFFNQFDYYRMESPEINQSEPQGV